ncbi:diguanylate cyclase [Aliidiomarina halalkaliphila]|uniref:diguanylate cyclase n=1 Tax=Aliidiomarina halalkaliphila TaxID=2593535 RepID=A0A552X4G4_9GAMM|nr:diguanylate cyclase [Aliidiomarina halalkaliphila]TRW49918.1 diguanylate cyclase [Aliidiomarina halalkaliphila]
MKDYEVEKARKDLVDGGTVSSVSPSLLTEIFDTFEDAVVVADISRCMVYVNSAAERLFGYSKNELYGEKTKMLYADESDFSEQGRKRFNAASKIAAENYRVSYRRADGELFFGLTTGSAMRTPDGEVVGFIGIIRPARSADQSLDTLQKVHNITSDIRLSHDSKIESLLRLSLDHFGLKIAIISSISGSNYTVEHCVDLQGELEPLVTFDLSGTYCIHTLSENKPVGFHFASKSEIKDHPCYKNFKLESYIGAPIRLSGQLYGTINFSSPLPAEPFCKDDYILMELLSDTVSYLLYKKQSEEDLERLARVDELTGLLNRRATQERLNQLIEQSARSAQNLSILSIDIDHFKNINDQWGHAAGDLALATFAGLASGLGRKTDFCGRIGGEEFLFVLPGTGLEDSQEFGNNLRKHLAESPINLDSGESITLSVSAGLAMLEDGESLESLLARADKAMYKAKQEGRDRVCRASHNNRVN